MVEVGGMHKQASLTVSAIRSARAVPWQSQTRRFNLPIALVIYLAVLAIASAVMKDRLLVSLAPIFEDRFTIPALGPNDARLGIVVLGGGLPRVQEAVGLANARPGAVLLLSGASEEEEEFARVNVKDPSRLLMDHAPTNTFENAIHTKRMALSMPVNRWVLVTSAIHMARAVGAFRAAGLSVTPWPVRDTPLSRDETARLVGHEIGGLIFYRLTRRGNSFFPSPEG